jgi:glycosyltransferase involved in cell wall biosynthesis
MSNVQKRILFAVTIAPTIRILMDGQIQWLTERGYEVHTCASGELESTRANTAFTHTHHTIPMTRKMSPLRDLRSVFRWFLVVARVRPEILVASTPKAALVSLIAGKVLRVPRRVYLLRGLRLETMTGWRRRLLVLSEKICASCANVVIAVSPSVGNEFVQLGLAPTRKVCHVESGSSNGVNSSWFTPLSESHRSALRTQLGINEDEVVVAFVGRLVTDKGWDVFCEATKIVQHTNPSVKVLALGSNEEALAVPPWIQHVGVSDEMLTWYRAMDILVLPTFREGFPNVPLEAAACEVPTIASRATGAIDSVVDGQTGLLVDVKNVSQTADAISRLVADAQFRTQLGRAARARVLRDFQPESIWQGYLDIYNSL